VPPPSTIADRIEFEQAKNPARGSQFFTNCGKARPERSQEIQRKNGAEVNPCGLHGFAAHGVLHQAGAAKSDRAWGDEWLLVAFKELMYNGLDACEERDGVAAVNDELGAAMTAAIEKGRVATAANVLKLRRPRESK
jgi:hypothetical protein